MAHDCALCGVMLISNQAVVFVLLPAARRCSNVAQLRSTVVVRGHSLVDAAATLGRSQCTAAAAAANPTINLKAPGRRPVFLIFRMVPLQFQ
jgi:hypothetical protein